MIYFFAALASVSVVTNIVLAIFMIKKIKLDKPRLTVMDAEAWRKTVLNAIRSSDFL